MTSSAVRFEIEAPEPERVLDFYARVFGWRARRLDDAWDHWILTDEDEDGAVAPRTPVLGRAPPDRDAACFVDVPSLEDYLERIGENGGAVEHPPVAVLGVGWVAMCRDPAGNRFGVVERWRAPSSF